MDPFGAGVSASCGSPLLPMKVPEIDGLLAEAGYRVRSSDLPHVAQRLERLESAMTNAPEATHLASEAVYYNPSDLASWVDSMLAEVQPASFPEPHFPAHFLGAIPSTPPASLPAHHQHQQKLPVFNEEEDSGIRLVHLLMSCAESIDRDELAVAVKLIDQMRSLLARVNTSCGIGKVAGCFIDALSRRMYAPQGALGSPSASAAAAAAAEEEILYHHFYEACPYLKFAHFTANQAILEAFDGHDRVHVIDFNLMHGLQWPALIQALALRPGGPPLLRLTGIGPPSPDGRDSLREIGLRLAELARSVNVRFAFRGVAAARLDDVKPWMLQAAPAEEAVAVNSVFQLHRLLAPDPVHGGRAPVEGVLGWIWGLSPRIVTVVEQEADHNQPRFLDRFTEALYYYSTMFDSLEAGGGVAAAGELERAVAEMYIGREVGNVVGCEGGSRVERHEPLNRWQARMGRAGFSPVHLGSNAFKQASMLLTLLSAEGYCVEERDGCLTIGWHNRPLIAASAWRATAPADDPIANPIAGDNNRVLQ